MKCEYMRIFILSLVLLFISVSFAFTQELTEPTSIPITYDVEIGWGSKPVSIWTPIFPTSITTISGMVSTTHIYFGSLGINKFEFTSADSTILLPLKTAITLSLLNVPSDKLFDIFRIHVRASVTYDGQTVTGAWSDPSYWVMVLNMKKLGSAISVK
jgi:hypothetical protein